MMIATESRMEMHGIAVFDVCGTITKTNNTSDFIGFVLRRSGLLHCLPLLVLRILGLCRLIPPSSLRARQIALLHGYPAARLQELARSYVETLFARGLANDRILAALRREKEAGRKIVLASAAIDPPIAAIAERLGARDFVSSELEIADGRCTGKLKQDLLGRKQAVLERLAARGDLAESSVYSDNPEDAEFMGRFARRYIVLNTSAAEARWSTRGKGFERFANYGPARSECDVDSIDQRTRKWVYIPLLYYLLSRFHRMGLLSLLLREILPATLAGWVFTTLGLSSLIVMPLSFFAFYCIYEVGGLANDLLAWRETSGRGTSRISPDVRIGVPLFVAIRVAAVATILASLPIGTGPLRVYAGSLLLCLAIYLVHSLLAADWRVATFTLLKLCRSCIPLAVLASYVRPGVLIWLCSIFFLIDAPWRLYMYCRQSGLVRMEVSISRVRCANVLILWGLGAMIYAVAGIPHLLALASYHVVIECLWGVCAMFPGRMTMGRSCADPCS